MEKTDTSKKKTGSAVLISLVIIIIVATLPFFYIGTYPNTGLHFGYYGKFNQTKDLILKINEVEILDSTQHKDITLEDYSFKIKSPNNVFRINFLETNQNTELFDRLEGVLFFTESFKKAYVLKHESDKMNIKNASDCLLNIDLLKKQTVNLQLTSIDFYKYQNYLWISIIE